VKIDLSRCALQDGGLSSLAQAFGSRNTTLQTLAIGENSITSTSVGVLIEMMEQNSHHITDLDLKNNFIGNDGASLLARSWEVTRCQTSHASPFSIAVSVMTGS
jgi:Ran GTPase-activating protein (RanGAP) involved in mRNA processing and transport